MSQRELQVRAAFENLRDPVYRYVFTILFDAAEAEDITQEAFLRLFREVNKGHKISNVHAWVFRVAHNLALTSRRDRRSASRAPEQSAAAMKDRRLDPEQSAITSQTQRAIARALERLSQQERLCLQLRSEGLRYREIADVLEIRISTVATFLARAVGKIAEAIRA